MRKGNFTFIIVLSTFISSTAMLYHSMYVSNSNSYVQDKSLKNKEVNYDKAYVKGMSTTGSNDDEITNMNDELVTNHKGYLKGDALPERELTNDYKSEDKKDANDLNESLSSANMKKDNKIKEMSNETRLTTENNSIESYYNYIKKNEQPVFKVSTGKIMESLTTSDKIKLLYVSMHLGKEEYNKVERYLYAEDAEAGVLKALKLLREDLSEKEYEKVRKIAGRFIDMDIAERLN